MANFITFLGIDDYKLLQDDKGYLFSADSVLLSNLVKIGADDRVLDLGTGCGVIATLIAIKKKPKKAVGIELNADACALAKKNVEMNKLTDRIEIIEGDVRKIRDLIKAESFEKVICNPPYFDAEESGSKTQRATSRAQSEGSIDDFVKAAAYALAFGGDFSIIYPASKITDLFCALRTNNLEPKKAVLIYPKLSKGVDTVIVTARKGGKCGISCETLIVMDEEGNYSEKVKELYR